jgi:hypothetical protein
MRTVVVALLLAAATPVLADPTPAAAPSDGIEKMSDKDCAQARKEGRTCFLKIEGIDVGGTRPGSTDATIGMIEFLRNHSLVKVRKDFIPEILRTAEDL